MVRAVGEEPAAEVEVPSDVPQAVGFGLGEEPLPVEVLAAGGAVDAEPGRVVVPGVVGQLVGHLDGE